MAIGSRLLLVWATATKTVQKAVTSEINVGIEFRGITNCNHCKKKKNQTHHDLKVECVKFNLTDDIFYLGKNTALQYINKSV